jgi:hypothetical protein
VLEDWLLERDDPRAALVTLEKQGKSTADELRRLARKLLGPQHRTLYERLYARDWRAGFLRECQYTGDAEMLAQFLATPASSLLRAFTLTTHLDPIDRDVGVFAGAICTRSLRVLTLSSWNHDGSDATVACAGIGQMRQLRHLVLRSVNLARPPALPHLHALTLAPMRTAVASLAGQLDAAAWPTITDLTYEAPDMLGAELGLTPLRRLCSAETFPALARLTITGIPAAERDRARDVIGTLCADRGVRLHGDVP